MNNELQQFVKEGISKGLSREKLADALENGGWQDDEIKTALASYAEVDFPIAVPRRKPGLSAREAFMYLVMFLTLYISAISLGTNLFQFINRWLPDPTEYSYYVETTTSIIRSATAALIITFPVFFWMSRVLRQAIIKDPEKRSSEVRKWLTYMTLFIAAGIILGDLITLVTYFLNGEVTLRFLLKIVTVLGISGSIFGFYLWDLRAEERVKPKSWQAYPAGLKSFIAVILAITGIVAVAGLWTAGSPAAQRARVLDQRRLSDLQSITYAIDNFYGQKGILPSTLETLAATRDTSVASINDPVTGIAYPYKTGSKATSYQLCATFDTDSVTNPDPSMPLNTSNFWNHPMGEKCYDVEVRNPTKPVTY